MMDLAHQEQITKNLKGLQRNIAAAAERSGRRVEEIEIMAVTKTLPAETVRAAVNAGIRLFGENRVQEAELKYTGLAASRSEAAFRLHLIGHLQRNKAGKAARLFDCVQSIDKYETAERLQQTCETADRKLDILLELNTSAEDTKSGFRTEKELRACLERILTLDRLRVRGLMTVGPWTEDRERIRAAFAALKRLFDDLRAQGLDWDTLSMGMSGDYETAVEEGSTLIRIGTALFGQRPSACTVPKQG
jgi:pyridoxal phosphate enzyme (YggS family)